MPRLPAVPTFHPATLLLAWLGLALCLPLLNASLLLALATAGGALAIWRARQRTVAMLRRARWLLLSLAVLFAFFTPGLRLAGLPGELGITEEGLFAALDHCARLFVLLATLALLHETLGSEGFVAGLYILLAPLAFGAGWRERIVVRLSLALEFMDSARAAGWREWMSAADEGPSAVSIAVSRPGLPDLLAVAFVLAAIGWLAW